MVKLGMQLVNYNNGGSLSLINCSEKTQNVDLLKLNFNIFKKNMLLWIFLIVSYLILWFALLLKFSPYIINSVLYSKIYLINDEISPFDMFPVFFFIFLFFLQSIFLILSYQTINDFCNDKKTSLNSLFSNSQYFIIFFLIFLSISIFMIQNVVNSGFLYHSILNFKALFFSESFFNNKIFFDYAKAKKIITLVIIVLSNIFLLINLIILNIKIKKNNIVSALLNSVYFLSKNPGKLFFLIFVNFIFIFIVSFSFGFLLILMPFITNFYVLYYMKNYIILDKRDI